MSVVGSYGEIVFEASRERMRSFSGFQRKSGARLSVQDVIGREPLVEFLGDASQTVSFRMLLLAALGVDPVYERDRLEYQMSQGLASALVIGGQPIGGSGVRWLIEELGESHGAFGKSGAPGMVEVDVSLRRVTAVGGVKASQAGQPTIGRAIMALSDAAVPAGEIESTVTMMGDVSNGSAVPMGEVTQAYADTKKAGDTLSKFQKAYASANAEYGKIRDAARTYAAKVEEMTAKGMPVIQEISRTLRTTDTVTRQLLGDGKIDFGKVNRAVATISSGYGRTAGLLGRRARVITGR
jgi:phage protein U